MVYISNYMKESGNIELLLFLNPGNTYVILPSVIKSAVYRTQGTCNITNYSYLKF